MLFGKKKAKAPQGEADAEAPAAAPAAEGEEGLTLDGDAAPRKKKPPMMLIAAALGAVVVLAGGGTGAYLVLFKKPPTPADAAAKAKAEKAKKAKAGAKDEKKEGGKPDPNAPVVKDGPDGVVFYTLPDVVVNMQTADGRPSFLKLKLTLELPDHDTADVLNPNMPRLQDMFQVFLRELRPEDLAGSQGGYQLRTEILRRVNLVIAPSRANAVLIEEMLVN
ncbi:MAG: flagellar basal body-associated FliL family protein [Mycobacterium sp.]|nr:flagellar basal body-associated FliL family protein [Mycobacterium sp.]